MVRRSMFALCVVALVGFAAAAEPMSPWQSLNEKMVKEDKYDTQYKEAPKKVKDTADVVLGYYEDLPYKLPFKVDKKQVQVAMKLLREAVKPVVTSETLREMVEYVDDAVHSFIEDVETQLYLRLVLDTTQEIYEKKESTQINAMIEDFLVGDAEGAKARSLGSMARYIETMMSDYIYSPLRRFLILPAREYIYEPAYSTVSGLMDRIGRFMGFEDEENEYYYEEYEYPQHTWSNGLHQFARRMGSLTQQVRQGLEVAAKVMEEQQ